MPGLGTGLTEDAPEDAPLSSILDIDLDYFNLVNNPVTSIGRLLAWAGRPVCIVAEDHAQVVKKWRRRLEGPECDTCCLVRFGP